MLRCAGDNAKIQLLLRFDDGVKAILETVECLLQQMMRVCQPQDFEVFGNRVRAQESNGGVSLSAARR